MPFIIYFLSDLIIRFARIATIPPVVIPDENSERTESLKFFRISGTNSTARPQEKLIAIIKIVFLFIS